MQKNIAPWLWKSAAAWRGDNICRNPVFLRGVVLYRGGACPHPRLSLGATIPGRDEPCPYAPTTAIPPCHCEAQPKQSLIFVGVGLAPTLVYHACATTRAGTSPAPTRRPRRSVPWQSLCFVGARQNPWDRVLESSAHLHCTKRSAVQVSPLHPGMQRGALPLRADSGGLSLRGAAEAIW